MSATKFLCIDDQQDATVDEMLRNLERYGAVAFTRRTPLSLDDQIPAIVAFAKESAGEPMGLLIDLRLDVDPDSRGNRVVYRGPTLAQELRTRMTEGELPPFPIVLWSVNTKFQKSYFGDESSHDLFDQVYGKDEQIIKEPERVTAQLASLALGYVKLRGVSGRDAMQRLGLDEQSPVYARFFSDYLDLIASKSEHEVAHFVLKELIGAEGLLVTEAMLAARLGVDIDASKEAWAELKGVINHAAYVGPFAEGWPRWWWFRVEDWWASISGDLFDLKRLTAAERVTRMSKLVNTQLVAAEPIEASYSTKYSTLCAATGRPLDPIDGLRVARTARAWHDTIYVSIYGALERINRENWRLDPLERERLDRIKEERSGA